MIIQDIILNDFVVLNMVVSMLKVDPFEIVLSRNTTISVQQIRNTIPILSIHGSVGQSTFITVENTNDPNAAHNAPLAVALL